MTEMSIYFRMFTVDLLVIVFMQMENWGEKKVCIKGGKCLVGKLRIFILKKGPISHYPERVALLCIAMLNIIAFIYITFITM